MKQADGGCSEVVRYAYKEYTADLAETGKDGVVYCHALSDTGSLLVGDDFFLVCQARQGDSAGWQMAKYDATTWTTAKSFFYPLTGYPREGDADPMLAYVNGQIDVSSQYNDNSTGTPPGLTEGAATHHQFFTTDLQFVGKRVLSDTPHITGSSMIYLNGVYHLVTANAYLGDMVVMQYDQNWNYLGKKTLKSKAFFPEGLAFDGSTFYVSYIDTSQRAGPTSLPLYQNVRLAAFDSSWNLLEDIAVTSFTPQDYKQPGRPWLILRDNRLYLSYDQDTVDPVTGQEELKGQAFVKIYELSTTSTTCTSFTISPTSVRPSAAAGSQEVTVTGSPSACVGGSRSASGNGSWITVSPESGSGSGSVTVSWTQNTSTSRSGNATIAGNNLVVNQNGTPLAACTEDATTMCLIGGRYQITSSWKNQYTGGTVSTLKKARLTDATGAFWLSDSGMYEYLIRISTATDNGRAWIAIPTFTDVEFWITVLDTVYGQSYTYHSPAGNRTLVYDPYYFVFP
jgi:hypothetical protein